MLETFQKANGKMQKSPILIEFCKLFNQGSLSRAIPDKEIEGRLSYIYDYMMEKADVIEFDVYAELSNSINAFQILTPEGNK